MSLSSIGNFKIGTKEWSPKNLKVTYDSLATSKSGRADDGTMKITWVRTNIRKVEITMPPMKMAALSTLLSAVSGKKYNMTFHDPRTNEEVTVEMYTSNSQGECYSGVLYNGLYQGVQFSAIEV
jgi:hypothetical protein